MTERVATVGLTSSTPRTDRLTQMKAKQQPRAALDGFRGLGAVLVVMYHLGYPFARNAWLNISLFFTVSGFVITGSTVNHFEKYGYTDIVRFWSRRMGRLIPAVFILVCIVAVVSHFQHPQPEDLFFLRGDLISALFYYENMHLISQHEDYFGAQQKPSVVRHLWTLAIEEQYYIVWPLLFSFWVQLFMGHPTNSAQYHQLQPVVADDVADENRIMEENNSETHLCIEDMQEAEKGQRAARFRRCLYALCVGECLILLFSHVAAVLTMQNHGMSAAYFSTASRCGDFASGGLVYLLVHLNPALQARYKAKEELPAMTISWRIFLELGSLAVLVTGIVPGTIQTPAAKLLPSYVNYWRLPYSLLAVILALAPTFQMSEPLPSWALFTRFLASTPMQLLGMISYGLYLFHWPLIVWFGGQRTHEAIDSGGISHFGSAPQPQTAAHDLGVDAAIVAGSALLATCSFFGIEKPLAVLASEQKKPWRVLASGFAASLAVAALVLALTAGGRDPAFSPRPAVQPGAPKLVFAGDSVALTIARQVQSHLVEGSHACDAANTTASQTPLLQTVNVAARETDLVRWWVPCGFRDCKHDESAFWRRHKAAREKVIPWTDALAQNATVMFMSDGFFEGSHDHESNGANDVEEAGWQAGLQSLFAEAAAGGVRHAFFLLSFTFNDEDPSQRADRQRAALTAFAQAAPCNEGAEAMQLSIVRWDALLCPDKVQGRCPRGAHGFASTLKDKLHPFGAAGDWLAAQLLMAMLPLLARSHLLPPPAAQSVVQCLAATYPPDQRPSLSELTETFLVCPTPP